APRDAWHRPLPRGRVWLRACRPMAGRARFDHDGGSIHHGVTSDNSRVLRAALVLLALTAIAYADGKGAESLTRGIQALDAGDYKKAENLFDSALAKGGLTRAQTLTTYIDLGVTLVLLGKTDAAERDFE